jgi:P pilus assembly chaperone PapD
MKRFVLPGLVALLSMTALAPVANAFGVGIQPSTVEMTIKEGDRQRQVVTIGNIHKEKTITLQLGLADWSLDEKGQLVLDAPGETERSAADWVRFSPAQVTLKPETSADVTVEITTPYQVGETGDHRFALLATTMLPEQDKRGGQSGVWAKYQLASLFYLTFQPSESLPVVTSASVDGEAGGMLTMQLANEGDAHARIQGTAMVKDGSGAVVNEVEINTVVLDGATRTLEMAVGSPDMTSGTYTVEFDLDNSFAPQNNFRRMEIEAAPVEYVAP